MIVCCDSPRAVVTSCLHIRGWPSIGRWLSFQQDATECCLHRRNVAVDDGQPAVSKTEVLDSLPVYASNWPWKGQHTSSRWHRVTRFFRSLLFSSGRRRRRRHQNTNRPTCRHDRSSFVTTRGVGVLLSTPVAHSASARSVDLLPAGWSEYSTSSPPSRHHIVSVCGRTSPHYSAITHNVTRPPAFVGSDTSDRLAHTCGGSLRAGSYHQSNQSLPVRSVYAILRRHPTMQLKTFRHRLSYNEHSIHHCRSHCRLPIYRTRCESNSTGFISRVSLEYLRHEIS